MVNVSLINEYKLHGKEAKAHDEKMRMSIINCRYQVFEQTVKLSG